MRKTNVRSIIKFFIPTIIFKLYGFLKKKNIFIKDNKIRTEYYSFVNNFVRNNSTISKSSPYVIIWEFGGFPIIFKKDIIIALALKLRGYKTHCVICDGVTKACIHKETDLGNWDLSCNSCIKQMLDIAKSYNLRYSLASEYIDSDKTKELEMLANELDVSKIKNYRFLGVRVGDFAYASFLRYNKGYPIIYGNLEEKQQIIFKKYFHASLVNTYIANQVIDKLKPLSIFTSHGVYTDYAPPVYLSNTKSIYCISWTSGFADYHHYYSRFIDNKYIYRSISAQNWEKRVKQNLTNYEKKILDEFILNRYYNNNSMDISFKNKPETNASLKEKLKIFNNNPIVCLFTHINWDAAVDFSSMIFTDSDEWVIESVKCMIKNTNVNWLIRIHPAERMHGTLYSVGENIRSVFKNIPEHIKIIWPHEEINTYSIYDLIDAGITIFGTVGVELPTLGKTIIVAGESHFSNKGFSQDATNTEEYFQILTNAHYLKRLSDNQIDLAIKYAYSYFIERRIPLNIIDKYAHNDVLIDSNRITEMLLGKDIILDAICDGITKGEDVIVNS